MLVTKPTKQGLNKSSTLRGLGFDPGRSPEIISCILCKNYTKRYRCNSAMYSSLHVMKIVLIFIILHQPRLLFEHFILADHKHEPCLLYSIFKKKKKPHSTPAHLHSCIYIYKSSFSSLYISSHGDDRCMVVSVLVFILAQAPPHPVTGLLPDCVHLSYVGAYDDYILCPFQFFVKSSHAILLLYF